jgi:hypothetical protein
LIHCHSSRLIRLFLTLGLAGGEEEEEEEFAWKGTRKR